LWNSTDGWAFSDSITAPGAVFGSASIVEDADSVVHIAGNGNLLTLHEVGSARWHFAGSGRDIIFEQYAGAIDGIFSLPSNAIVVGATSLSGSETLRVAGSSLLEGAVTATGAFTGTSAHFSD